MSFRTLVCAQIAAAALTLGATPARGASWPEFHGPRRDNIAPDIGLLSEWPADGPPLAWRFAECGRGYAPVSIADGLVFTSGDFGDDEMLIALDLDGNPKWRVPNGRAWKGSQPGSRTTPTYSDGVLYHLGPHGSLSAFTAATGQKLWTVDVKERFAAPRRPWGYCENLVVDGDLVLCMPGGPKGRIAALDKKSGRTVWANTDFEDRAAYVSPLVVTHLGVRQLVTLARSTMVSVEVSSGRLLWTHPHRSTCDQNVTTPVFHEGHVFVSSGHRAGSRVVRLASDSSRVEQVWAGTELDNCHGGVVLLGDHLYGSGCRLYGRGLMCVEFATGRTVYNAQEVGKVSITYAGGKLYCLGNDSSVALVDVDPQRATIVSRFTPPWEKKPPCLSHPVVCGGRLYVRHLDELLALDIRRDTE